MGGFRAAMVLELIVSVKDRFHCMKGHSTLFKLHVCEPKANFTRCRFCHHESATLSMQT